MSLPCFLSFIIGFLSLSQEILWMRLFSFTNHSIPQAFAFVLVVYLVGIASGAAMGSKVCRHFYHLWTISGIILLIASFFDVIGPWCYAYLSHHDHQIGIGAVFIFLTAACKAVIFPIAHHLGTPADNHQMGRAVSKVYVANIIGATLGPIVVGLIWLNYITTQQAFIVCAAGTFSVSMLCLNLHRTTQSVTFLLSAILFSFLLTRDPSWLIKTIAQTGPKLVHIIENRYGIVTIYQGDHGDDIVFGANVYDGRTNLDPVINSNWINRVIILSALHDKPKKILMIGLSIGTWLKLLTSFPSVEHIDVVEINPGYLDAMKYYPRQHSALLDHRVHLKIDDGRRFLRTHPDKKYDLIIMNTTYYWRAYTTNLLSFDFLTLLKTQMEPHAILAYNSTGSMDAFHTATHVFSNAYLYQNFIIASDDDWRQKLLDPASIQKIASLKLDGKPLYPKGSDQLIAMHLHIRLISIKEMNDLYEVFFPITGRHLELITDANLITEFKYGHRLVR